jgi:hypothetical protein
MKMNVRTLALATLTAVLLAPSAFAGSDYEYRKCLSKDMANNGGLSCETLRDKDMIDTNAFAVQADAMEGKKSVYLFDTWPGKSTK